MVSVLALKRALLYLTMIAGFVGSALFSIKVGFFHLFPYRFLLSSLWMLFVIGVLFNQGRVRVSHIRVKPYLGFLLLWLLYAIFSLAWAVSKGDAIRDIIFLFIAVSMIFFTVYYFNDLSCLKWFYYLWIFVFIGLIPVAIWEMITGNHLAVSALAQTAHPGLRFTPTTVFHNSNDYATYLVLSLPFILTWIRYYGGLVGRLLGGLMLIAGLYLLLVTNSRANYLAVLVGSAFWFFFLLRFREKVRVSILIGSLVLVLLVVFPSDVQGIFITAGIQLDTLGNYSSRLTASSISVRADLIRNALTFFTNSFGFGVGAGNVEYHMANSRIYATFGIVNVHNWWVEILADYGLYIFLGYVAFYLRLLLNLYRAYGKLEDTTERMIGEGLLVSLVSFSLASISSSSIMALRAQWMLFAFALAFLNYLRTELHEKQGRVLVAPSE